MASDDVARALVRQAGVLLLPGTMFMPEDRLEGRRALRIAFANIDRAGVGGLFDRLDGLTL
jgi:aspartate/methionine/tyrosine aminotransferase